jgi:hypothetical protein
MSEGEPTYKRPASVKSQFEGPRCVPAANAIGNNIGIFKDYITLTGILFFI